MSASAEQWVEALAAPRRAETAGPSDSSAGAWLETRRLAALDRFRDRGFPTRREEAWKYTNPQRISAAACTPAPHASLDAAALAALPLLPVDGFRVLFVNGRLQRDHSPGLGDHAHGLHITPIGPGFGAPDAAARARLDAAPTLDDRAFASLAEAFFEHALAIRAEAGAQIERPVDVVFVSTGDGPRFASFPRLWVHGERGSRLAVREVYLGTDTTEHLTDAISQYHAAENAVLERCSIQIESGDATFLSSVALRAERDAQVANRAFSFGAQLAREDLVCELGGPGATCELQGLYLAGDGQHSDHHTTVDHQVPQCTSRQLYRGVLGGRSRAAFSGTVVVRSGAQQSDARQKNESLLLSEHAEADSKPQLEIYADDVKCSHGSTIGQLDADQIFYLRSRGIGEEEARATLIRGFASSICDGIEHPALRAAIDAQIAERLRRGIPHE